MREGAAGKGAGSKALEQGGREDTARAFGGARYGVVGTSPRLNVMLLG